MLGTTDCPVFEVKAKINASVPSDVINRSMSIDYSTNRFRLVVHSKARTGFDKVTKNQPSNTWISWVNIQKLYFPLSREKVMVELGIAISVSVRFGRIFDMRSAPHDLFFWD